MSEESLQKALDAALRYIAYRPRSESEVRSRLRRSFDADIIKDVLQELRERNLVNDTSFAHSWADNRASFSPRSKRLIMLELRKKGVGPEEASCAVEHMDDEITAYQAGQRKARSLKELDYHGFQKKLGSFLQRRGYSYGVIEPIVQRLWQEVPSNSKQR